MNQEEQKASRMSVVITLMIQVAIVICLYLVTAWKAPNPPLPIYGVELTVLNQSAIQTPIQQILNEEPQEIQEAETNDLAEKIVDTESDTEMENVSSSEQAEELIENNTSPENTPINTDKPQNQDVEEISSSTNDQKNQPSKQAPTIDSTLLFTKQSNTNPSKETTTTNKSESIKENNIDGRSLFPISQGENKSETSNVLVNVAGFRLMEQPVIRDTSDESGMITFEIEVGADGYITRITEKQKTVSPSVATIYRDAVYELVFEKTTAQVPVSTSGTITFIIKAN